MMGSENVGNIKSALLDCSCVTLSLYGSGPNHKYVLEGVVHVFSSLKLHEVFYNLFNFSHLQV